MNSNSDDDIWGDDDDEDNHRDSELEREWHARREEFRNVGFREGIEAGKQETIQEGFDQGYGTGVSLGYEWGVIRGALLTLQSDVGKSCITDHSTIQTAHNKLNTLSLEDVQSDEFRPFLLNKKNETGCGGDEAATCSCRSVSEEGPSGVSMVKQTKKDLKEAIENSGFRIQGLEK